MDGYWPFFFKYVGGGWVVGTALALALTWLFGWQSIAILGGVGSLGGMLLGGWYGLRREFPAD